jgi:membrane protein DedA with SNARE-associated domain
MDEPTLIESITRAIATYGYGVVFLAMVLENTIGLGILVPGVVLVIAAGFYAGTGDLHLGGVLVSAYAGTLIGDNLSYALGRYGLVRLPLLHRYAPQVARVEKLVQSRTVWLLVLFHFLSYTRLVVPALLGMLHFDLRRWWLLDSAGALLFTCTFTALGYGVGRTAQALDLAFEINEYIQVAAAIVIAILAAAFAFAGWRYLQRVTEE